MKPNPPSIAALLMLAALTGGIATPARAASLDAGATLHPGQHAWDDAGEGPLRLTVSIARQMLFVYRGDRLVGMAAVSTGKRGKGTPLGDFTILQKRRFHRSNLYSNAPMPFMQRLTWTGIALHAGHNPGYPASHGCIRLPRAFAERLFAMTQMGDPVSIVAEGPGVSAPPVQLEFDQVPWQVDDGVLIPPEAERAAPPKAEPPVQVRQMPTAPARPAARPEATPPVPAPEGATPAIRPATPPKAAPAPGERIIIRRPPAFDPTPPIPEKPRAAEPQAQTPRRAPEAPAARPKPPAARPAPAKPPEAPPAPVISPTPHWLPGAGAPDGS